MKMEILCGIVLASAMALAACASAPTATAVPPAATALPPTKTPTPLPTATLAPLEKPDEATFKALFNELYLTNAQPTTLFKVGDKICPILDIKKEMQGSVSIYDPIMRTEILNKDFRLDWADVFQFCQPFGSAFTPAPGKYELRFRVNDQLVAVWPVEVQTNETGMPAPPEYPNTELFQKYFNSINVSNMQPTSVYATSDRVALYIDAKKDIPILSGGIYDINKQAYLFAQKFTVATLLKPGITAIFLPLLGGFSTMTPGKYEFNFWAGDTLVDVWPFEVR